MHRLFHLALPLIALGHMASAQDAPRNADVLFILDGSGSMWGRVNDVEKIVIAKDVMSGLIDGLPDSVDAGLITYGHRERGSCADIEVIATPGQTDRADLLASLSGVTPLGKTPISDSLLRAGEVMRQTEDPVSIVLVSDGIESCEGDPCATAALLREQDIDVRIHVVGFDVDAEAKEQLSCIAEAGGGEYYDASSADALDEALADVRVSIVEEPVVVEPVVTPVAPQVANLFRADDILRDINIMVFNADTGEEIDVLLPSDPELEVPAGTYRFEFGYPFQSWKFIPPQVSIEAGSDYTISAADYGLATVIWGADNARNVGIVEDATNSTILSLMASRERLQIPPSAYRFDFGNFVSPPVMIEPGGEYTISASDYALATVRWYDDIRADVKIVNDATGDDIATIRKSSSSAQIPPGTYRFAFRYFTSPPVVIEPDSDYTVTAADYGLATINWSDDILGDVDVIDDASGEEIVSLRKSRSQVQLAPGDYRFVFSGFASPAVTIGPNSTYTISAADYGLATVSLAERVRGDFLLLQGDQDPINLKDGREKQVLPGPYAMVYRGEELGIINIDADETRVIEVSQ